MSNDGQTMIEAFFISLIDWNIVKKLENIMVKKLEIDHNEKGEIVSPSYVDIVSKINEIIEIISIEKVDKEDLR